jgi:hypothetical protein
MKSKLERRHADLQEFLGIKDDVPKGFQAIRMYVDINADQRENI